jgi:hypothetical protein
MLQTAANSCKLGLTVTVTVAVPSTPWLQQDLCHGTLIGAHYETLCQRGL